MTKQSEDKNDEVSVGCSNWLKVLFTSHFIPILFTQIRKQSPQMDGSTHACKMEQCGGGVGRNIAEALWRMRGGRTKLLTALGNDADGEYLANIAPGLIPDDCVMTGAKSSMYAAVFDARGECLLGLGDMNIHEYITPHLIDKHVNYLKEASLVVLDGNVPVPTISYVLRLCHQYEKPVFFEPTDRRKASMALQGLRDGKKISYSSPNISELRAMAKFVRPNLTVDTCNILNEIIDLSNIVSQYVHVQIITLGSKGLVTVKRMHDNGNNHLSVRLYPVKQLPHVENVSGAGDCFSSGFIYGVLLGLKESRCVSIGFEAAKQSLHSKKTVPLKFNIKSKIEAAAFKKICLKN